MIGRSKKKETASIRIRDKVWMAREAKLQSFLKEWKNNSEVVFIFWFDESLKLAESFFAKYTTAPVTLLTAREANAIQLQGKKIILTEHFPLRQKENDLFQKLKLEEAEVWSSLDEPLFKYFGGEKIIQLMKQLGMDENDFVEHAMISKAIQNAQEKISKKMIIDQTSNSQSDWLHKNLNL